MTEIILSQYILGLTVGLGFWVLAYGANRAWLGFWSLFN